MSHEEMVGGPPPQITKVLEYDDYNDAENAFEAAITLGLDVEWKAPGIIYSSIGGKRDDEEAAQVHTVILHFS